MLCSWGGVNLLGWEFTNRSISLWTFPLNEIEIPLNAKRNSIGIVFFPRLIFCQLVSHLGLPFERSSVFFQVLIGLLGLVALAACAEEPSDNQTQNVQRQDQTAEKNHASLKRDVTEDYAEDAHAPSAAAAEAYSPSAGTAEAYAPATAYATAPAAAYAQAPVHGYATAPSAAAYISAPATAYAAAAAVPVGIAAAPSAADYEPAPYPS